MAIDWKIVKHQNSKGDLIEHIKTLHIALQWYARKENWSRIAGTNPTIWQWNGDDLPTYAADVTLGITKADPNYKNNYQLAKEARERNGQGK